MEKGEIQDLFQHALKTLAANRTAMMSKGLHVGRYRCLDLCDFEVEFGTHLLTIANMYGGKLEGEANLTRKRTILPDLLDFKVRMHLGQYLQRM